MRIQHRSTIHPVPVAFIFLTILLLACSTIGQSTASLESDAVDIEATIAAGIAGTQQAQINAQATIDSAVSATQQAASVGQGSASQPSANAPAAPPPPAPDSNEIFTAISNEVQALVGRDMSGVRAAFAPNAIVVDRNGTPGNPDDDIIWNGWPNIEQRYRALFSGNFTTLTLVELAVEFVGTRAIGKYNGILVDNIYHEDEGIYTLENVAGRWQITHLELGNKIGYSFLIPRDDGRYILTVGNQHRYDEPWGWDKGDPCKAWQNGDWDDTKPNYRGFNIELLVTNNSDSKIPDNWPVTFLTKNGESVRACHYGYKGSGPPPGATSSVTFFTVVEKGDYVDRITFKLDGQTINLCLDGQGDWWRCEQGR